MVRGVGVVGLSTKNNSGFELCCPFLTSTPSFIQIGPKLAKLVFWGVLSWGWGWMGVLGWGVVGGVGTVAIASYSEFKL